MTRKPMPKQLTIDLTIRMNAGVANIGYVVLHTAAILTNTNILIHNHHGFRFGNLWCGQEDENGRHQDYRPTK